jgi:hypothetical protein
MNPAVKKEFQRLNKSIEEDAIKDFEQRRQLWIQPRTPTPQELKARLEAQQRLTQIEAQYALQTMHMMNLFQPVRRRQPVEEVKDIFTQPFEQISRHETQKTKALLEVMEASGKLFEGFLPNTDYLDEHSQGLKEAIREMDKRDREDRLELAKLMAEGYRKARERREEMLKPFNVYTSNFPWE